ncbi:MAG: flagellar assembly protein T N-terminal domain-containing protein, partial [Deltaproteobacteria bacterium]|nr:flagellar assembly protein T N-terminal domain-containing protein [Deltaproteobacteria bacterium]MBW2012003.1 flagellar assembly protein T N-terminal domain-containing protein [Deltaproteobacteria bacterium]
MFKFFCFREKLAYLILFFAVLLSTSAAIQAEEQLSHTVIVNAMGRARISEGNTAAAREQAISDALLSALEQAVGNVLPLDPLVQNFHKVNEILYGNSDDFIREYRVLAETRYENFYGVMLQASVSVENLKQSLSDTEVIPGKSKKFKILFLMAKQHPKDTAPEHLGGDGTGLPETAAERTMAETMREKGFLVLDHEGIPKDLAGKNLFNADFDDKTAVNIGRHGYADVVIVGKLNLQESMGSVGSAIKSFKGTVELRALRTDTGEIIASVF